MALLPQIENPIINQTEIITLPSRTYKLIIKEDQNDRISGFTDNLGAVKQAIYHILMTERYSYEIYSNNYGVELEQYIGKGMDYLSATIESTLREALLMDLRITDLQIISIEQISSDSALIKFEITSIYGNLQLEVNINV